jgi:hypothetical protein
MTQELHYRTRLSSRSLRPGAHRSRVEGSGLDIAASVPLARARDPRRLDLRTALRDPFGGWWAFQTQQRASVGVVLLLDASASMAARGPAVQALAQALSHAARRRGDPFGVIAFAHTLDESCIAPPSRRRAQADAVLQRVRDTPPDGRSADAVEQAARHTPAAGALVLLVSDFLFDPARLDRALALLARHDVVPVWLRDADAAPLPQRGLLDLRDAESGAWRSLWMRPGLARRWAAARSAHESAVRAVLTRHQRAPLMLGASFDADAANAYFAAR